MAFVAKVMIKDPTYELDGLTYFVPEWNTWSEIPYLEPHQCCCNHASYECVLDDMHLIEEHGTTMCRECRVTWEEDHIVRLPNLV